MYSSTVQTPSRRRAAELMAGTALGCSLLLALPAVAASDECGPAAPGAVVVCSAAGAPYAAGIAYTNVTGGLTLQFQNGGAVDAVGAGVTLRGAGPLSIDTRNISVKTTGGAGGTAAIATSGTGAATIQAGAVEVDGDFLTGIRGVVDRGGSGTPTLTVTADTVVANGGSVSGVTASSGMGAIDVNVGSVSVTGESAQGIFAFGADDVNVQAETVRAVGRGAVGVWAVGEGDVEIDVGEVVTEGDNAVAIIGYSGSGSALSIRFDDIRTGGSDAAAIEAEAGDGGRVTVVGGDVTHLGAAPDRGAAITILQRDSTPDDGDNTVTLDIDRIVTGARDAQGGLSGDFTSGAHIEVVGDVFATVDEIVTHGYGAVGMDIKTPGDITVDVGSIETWGEFAKALDLGAQGAGAIEVEFGSILTRDNDAGGVQAYAETGDVTVIGGRLETNGNDATGVSVETAGAVLVDVDEVTTRGERSAAIGVSGGLEDGGLITIRSDSLVTEGNRSSGLRLTPQTSNVVATIGSIGTTGRESAGVSVSGEDDDTLVTLDIEEITTEGALSAAVSIDGGGAVDLSVDSIRTLGNGSRGVEVFRDSELVGPATVNLELGSVSTGSATGGGFEADGVYVQNAGLTTITVENSINTFGGLARGVEVDGQNEGGVDLTVKGVIQTRRDQSSGVWIEGVETAVLELGDVIVSGFESQGVVVTAWDDDGEVTTGTIEAIIGDVSTDGVGGVGVDMLGVGAVTATIGDVSTTRDISSGVRASSTTGDVNLTVASVTTGGVNSTGVMAASETGDVTVRSGNISTAGLLSNGVRVTAGGNADLRLASIATTGNESHGVWVQDADDVLLNTSAVTTRGTASRAILVAASGDVEATVTRANASGADGVGVQISGRSIDLTINTEAHGTRVGADLDATASLAVVVGAGASVTGDAFGLDLSSGNGTVLTNRGVLSSTAGIAMNVDGGAATISNIGSIVGRFDLTAANDMMSNTGTLRLRGESDFGAANDLLTNSAAGSVVLAESTTPLQARLRNLERFDNAGVIDLTNGVAGDLLTIDGVLNGQAGNSVRLDLDTRTATIAADRLAVGSLEGVTQVRLEVLGTGVLGDTGVTLITSGAAQTGQEVVVTVDSGFLEYEAMFDAASREYRVVGLVDEERAFEPTKVASGGQLQWRRGADVISARLDELSDGAALGLPRGEHAQTWIQAYGGSSDVDARRTIDGEAVNLSHDVDVAGAQMGVDILRGLGGGDLVLGGAASYGETQLAFASNGDRADFTGWGLAAYAQWTQGPLVLGVTAKSDQYELDYDWASVDLTDAADGRTVGARIDAAWRLETGTDWRIEPRVSLSWTDTDLDAIEADAGEVEFGDTVSVLGKFGLRVARGMTLSTGARFQPYAGVYAFNEFEGDNASRIHLSSETIDVSDIAAERWGEAVLGANLAYGPVQAFVQGEASFGEIEGFTARIGARLNW